MARAPDDRCALRSHRPQPCPLQRTIVVGAVWIEILGDAQHEIEIARRIARVVASELRCSRDAHAIAEARNGDQIILVDGADGRRIPMISDRYRQRIALDRIDRQLDTQLACQDRALVAETHDVDVGTDVAPRGMHGGDSIAVRLKAENGSAVTKFGATALARGSDGSGELAAVACLIRRAVDAT